MSWENDRHPEWLSCRNYEVRVRPGKGDFRRVGAGGPGYKFFDVCFGVKPEDRRGNRAHYDEPQHRVIEALSEEDAADFWVAHLERAWGCTVTILSVKEEV